VYALRTQSSLSTRTATQSAYTFRLSRIFKEQLIPTPQSPVAITSQQNLKRNHFHCDLKTRSPCKLFLSFTKSTAWLRGKDLNLRPSGYEPDELPDCSTPRLIVHLHHSPCFDPGQLSSTSTNAFVQRRSGIMYQLSTSRKPKG
jgi:hypothetical protein